MVAAVTPLTCAHAAEIERLLDMLAVARPEADAGRLLRRIGEGVARLALVEAQHRGGGGRGEGIGETAPAVPSRCFAVAQRGHNARADVVGRRHGAHKVAAGSPGELRGGERRRQGGAAKMNRADRVGVVGLVGMGRHRVGPR